MTRKEYVLYIYKLFDIDLDKRSEKKNPDLSLGELWWNRVSIDPRFINEDQINYCTVCERDNEKVRTGEDVSRFDEMLKMLFLV